MNPFPLRPRTTDAEPAGAGGTAAPSTPAAPGAPAVADPAEIFVGRQPILNSEQRIIGYELLFRSSAQARTAQVADPIQATSRLLHNTFSSFGVERVLGDKKAFINVTAELLETEVLELLPPAQVVVEILEDVDPTEAVIERCRALQRMGFQFALDDFVYRPEIEPLLALASYVKLDIHVLGLARVAEQMRRLRGRSLQVIAEKVETPSEFEACRGLMIDYFQGYYFARPETLSMRRIDPAVQRVMQLYNLTASGAPPPRIEAEFKQDVALSFNLLRYINSAGFGLMHKVSSIRHALVVLGHAKLSRWLTLLMLSQANSTPAPQALFRTALVRGRMTELLGRARLRAGDDDQLFITGMFSLLDAMLAMPMEQALADLKLPDAVREALIVGTGSLAPFLHLTKACEALDTEAIAQLAAPLGLCLGDVTRAQIEALAWAEELGALGS